MYVKKKEKEKKKVGNQDYMKKKNCVCDDQKFILNLSLNIYFVVSFTLS